MNLDHVNIVVSDLERSCRFYADVLGLRRGFEAVLEGEWIERVTGLTGVRAQCVFFEFPAGGPRLEILRFESPDGTGFASHSLPNTLGARHIAFNVPEIHAFADRLRAAGVPLLSDPVEVPFLVGNAGKKRIFYFHDPDGILLEAAAYEQS